MSEPHQVEAKGSLRKPRREGEGLACPSCGCKHLPVSYTRHRAGCILRVRVCRHCGKRVPTRERA